MIVGEHPPAAGILREPKKNGSWQKNSTNRRKFETSRCFSSKSLYLSCATRGEDLKKVIAFRKQIEEGKKYLFKAYAATDEFHEKLEAQLAGWLREHESTRNVPSSGEPVTVSSPATIPLAAPAQAGPNFDYWIGEANRLTNAEPTNYSGALFCSERALAAASTEIEWARAKNSLGIAQFHLRNLDEAIAAFSAIVERLGSADDSAERAWAAQALVNKGITLGQLGRREEAATVYDDVVARVGAAPEPSLREQVARALAAKEEQMNALPKKGEV
jgi:tetratricopeptide (TPR) repeat protein